MIRCFLLVAALVSPLTAQQASYTMFGTPCAQLGPLFQVTGVPRIGGSFTIRTDSSSLNAGSAVATVILTGVSDRSLNGLPLPFDPTPLSTPSVSFCGVALVSWDVVTNVPSTFPSSQPIDVTINVPNDPGLIGTTFFQQVLSSGFRVPVGPERHGFSQGGRGVIGR